MSVHINCNNDWLVNIFQDDAVIFQLISQHVEDITSIIMLYKDKWAPQNARNNFPLPFIDAEKRAQHLEKFCLLDLKHS